MTLPDDSLWMRIVRGEAKAPRERLCTAGLRALSVAYGAALKLHIAGYRLGIARRTRFPVLVVSVGNLTLGGTGREKGKRHPTVGTNVVIGAGAKVLGNIKIGDNSYIGSNAVVIKDVPDNSTVVGVPGRITKQDGKKIEISLDHVHVLDPLLQEIDELKKRLDNLEK